MGCQLSESSWCLLSVFLVHSSCVFWCLCDNKARIVVALKHCSHKGSIKQKIVEVCGMHFSNLNSFFVSCKLINDEIIIIVRLMKTVWRDALVGVVKHCFSHSRTWFVYGLLTLLPGTVFYMRTFFLIGYVERLPSTLSHVELRNKYTPLRLLWDR